MLRLCFVRGKYTANCSFRCHIFYSQRVVDLPDGKPKWVGLDNGSELMKDVEPHEAETVVGVRKVETTD
jgi:hypothetical protein